MYSETVASVDLDQSARFTMTRDLLCIFCCMLVGRMISSSSLQGIAQAIEFNAVECYSYYVLQRHTMFNVLESAAWLNCAELTFGNEICRNWKKHRYSRFLICSWRAHGLQLQSLLTRVPMQMRSFLVQEGGERGGATGGNIHTLSEDDHWTWLAACGELWFPVIIIRWSVTGATTTAPATYKLKHRRIITRSDWRPKVHHVLPPSLRSDFPPSSPLT